MADGAHILIIGAGPAGALAAATLRAEGFDGDVVLVGEERALPYERPVLSKEYLRGAVDGDDVSLFDPAELAALGIEVRTGASVVGLELDRRAVVLDSGRRLRFDQLLLAPGLVARELPVPGARLAGVHRLRDLADAAAVREQLAGAERVAVVGAGWLAAELAASARTRGHDVTLLSGARPPLEAHLGRTVAAVFADAHRAHGVHVVSGPGVAAFEGRERVRAVRLSDGRRVLCDLALLAVGARPRTGLATLARLAVSQGILADSRLRTSAPGVFVAGDAARALHPHYGRHLRVEHWPNAVAHGVLAAHNLLGADRPQRRLPAMFSELYGVRIEHRGHHAASDAVVLRGAPEAGRFMAFWLRAGRVVAALDAGIWDDDRDVTRLLEAEAPAAPALLADPAVPLADL